MFVPSLNYYITKAVLTVEVYIVHDLRPQLQVLVVLLRIGVVCAAVAVECIGVVVAVVAVGSMVVGIVGIVGIAAVVGIGIDSEVAVFVVDGKLQVVVVGILFEFVVACTCSVLVSSFLSPPLPYNTLHNTLPDSRDQSPFFD